MAAKSNNKYDIYDWINQVIKSAKDKRQLGTARKLVNNFKLRYPQEKDLYLLLNTQIVNNFSKIFHLKFSR